MSHFYGIVEGNAKTRATRRGSRNSGLKVTAASWDGAVEVSLRFDAQENRNYARISLIPWDSHGVTRVIYHGPVDAQDRALLAAE